MAATRAVEGTFGPQLLPNDDTLVDEDEVHLKAGDVVVQRGTNHAWSNRSDKPAAVAFVLIGAKPRT